MINVQKILLAEEWKGEYESNKGWKICLGSSNMKSALSSASTNNDVLYHPIGSIRFYYCLSQPRKFSSTKSSCIVKELEIFAKLLQRQCGTQLQLKTMCDCIQFSLVRVQALLHRLQPKELAIFAKLLWCQCVMSLRFDYVWASRISVQALNHQVKQRAKELVIFPKLFWSQCWAQLQLKAKCDSIQLLTMSELASETFKN